MSHGSVGEGSVSRLSPMVGMIRFLGNGWTKVLSSLLAVGTYYKWSHIIVLTGAALSSLPCGPFLGATWQLASPE